MRNAGGWWADTVPRRCEDGGGERREFGAAKCKLEDTVKSFKRIVDGEFDDVPEQAFYMRGGIEEVIEAAEKMKAQG